MEENTIIHIDSGFNRIFKKKQYSPVTQMPAQTVIDNIPVAHEQETFIQYVERPAGDNAQVEIENVVPDVVVSANDKEYKMPSTVNETQVFENGQFKIKQEATTKIDVTKMVNEQMEQERKEIKRKQRIETAQKTFWGVVAGVIIDAIVSKMIKALVRGPIVFLKNFNGNFLKRRSFDIGIEHY